MLKNLPQANTDHETTAIQRQIDGLVYRLYGLREEEIGIVEAEV